MFYSRVIRRLNVVQEEIREIEKQIRDLPEGAFTCQRNGKYFKWRVTKGKEQIYIAKQDRHLAERFALKKYLSCRLANLENEKIAIQTYLDIHNRFVNMKDEDLVNHPEYRKLLSPYPNIINKEAEAWANRPYKSNPYYPEDLIHETSFGLKVRSKGEQMIAEALFRHGFYFHYEEELVLGDTTYYPDFIIWHPKTNQLIIWENAGRVDDSDYMYRLLNKLQNYFQYGYYPSINLILSFDTKKDPLSMERIERILEMYFDCD